MSAITVDENLLPLLQRLDEVTEVRDAQGQLVGYFAPVARQQARLYAKALSMLDPEEIKRRKEQDCGQGHTIEQVMQHLQSLEA